MKTKKSKVNRVKKQVKSGFFWHIHHEILLEHSGNINERVAYIKSYKPKDQIEIRLRLMKPVKGELPQEVVKAGKVYGEAENAYNEAGKAYNEARNAYDEAWNAYDEARKAWEEALQRNKGVIEELHRKECPNCPWDGKTIFPKGAK